MFNLFGKQINWPFFIFYFFSIFIRTDRRENKVGTVSPIAKANMRDFERKKKKVTNKKQKQIEWSKKQEHIYTAAN